MCRGLEGLRVEVECLEADGGCAAGSWRGPGLGERQSIAGGGHVACTPALPKRPPRRQTNLHAAQQRGQADHLEVLQDPEDSEDSKRLQNSKELDAGVGLDREVAVAADAAGPGTLPGGGGEGCTGGLYRGEGGGGRGSAGAPQRTKQPAGRDGPCPGAQQRASRRAERPQISGKHRPPTTPIPQNRASDAPPLPARCSPRGRSPAGRR